MSTTSKPKIELRERVMNGLSRGRWTDRDAVAALDELIASLRIADAAADMAEMVANDWRRKLERAEEKHDAFDRLIRETISVWDAKGPLIASEELRERYANFAPDPEA